MPLLYSSNRRIDLDGSTYQISLAAPPVDPISVIAKNVTTTEQRRSTALYMVKEAECLTH